MDSNRPTYNPENLDWDKTSEVMKKGGYSVTKEQCQDLSTRVRESE